jgi:hypothetical protein
LVTGHDARTISSAIQSMHADPRGQVLRGYLPLDPAAGR